MSNLFSFQGKVFLGDRTAEGKLINPVWMGDATAELGLETSTTDHNESFSGQRLLYGQLDGAKTASLTLTLWEWTPQSIALALYAAQLETAGGTVSGEAFPDGLLAGDMLRLDNPFVSDLEISDSAAAPLVNNTNYRIESANAGLIQLLDLGSLVQPFSAAYSYASREAFTIFEKTPPEKWFFLDGINTENQQPVLIDLYRTKFTPAGTLAIHTDEYGNLELSGSVLFDELNAGDPQLGGFGRVIQKAA